MAEIQDKCQKCGAKVNPGYDFCLSCGTKFSELPPIKKIQGHRDRDSKFWTKLGAYIFLGLSLIGAIVGGVVATIISINIAGISLALLWAIPIGIMIGTLAPSILMMVFAIAQD